VRTVSTSCRQCGFRRIADCDVEDSRDVEDFRNEKKGGGNNPPGFSRGREKSARRSKVEVYRKGRGRGPVVNST